MIELPKTLSESALAELTISDMHQEVQEFLEMDVSEPISIPRDFTVKRTEAIQDQDNTKVKFIERKHDLCSESARLEVLTAIHILKSEHKTCTQILEWYQSNRKNTGLTFIDKNSNSKFSRILKAVANVYEGHIRHLEMIYDV